MPRLDRKTPPSLPRRIALGILPGRRYISGSFFGRSALHLKAEAQGREPPSGEPSAESASSPKAHPRGRGMEEAFLLPCYTHLPRVDSRSPGTRPEADPLWSGPLPFHAGKTQWQAVPCHEPVAKEQIFCQGRLHPQHIPRLFPHAKAPWDIQDILSRGFDNGRLPLLVQRVFLQLPAGPSARHLS